MSATIKPAKVTKITHVRQLLERAAGASLSEICDATGWQPHSARAALSGLRKADSAIERQPAASEDGEARYVVLPMPAAPVASK